MRVLVHLTMLTLAAALTIPSVNAERASSTDSKQHIDSAFRDHRISLAERLSTDNNPRRRMAAAILISGEAKLAALRQANADKTAPTPARFPLALDVDELVSSALAQAPNDPLLLWIAATNCPASLSSCEPQRALEQLRELQPDNAVVWLQSHMPTHPTGANTVVDGSAAPDAIDEAERLKVIAAATRADGFNWDVQRLLLDAFLQQPIPDELLQTGDFAEPTQEKFAVLNAIGYEMAFVANFYSELRRLCSEDAVANRGETHRGLCIAALRNLASHADTVLLESLSKRSLMTLLPEGDERDALLQSLRRNEWQMAASANLLTPDADAVRELDLSVERHLAALQQDGATETTFMRESLIAAGISLEPPEGWTSPYDLGANQR